MNEYMLVDTHAHLDFDELGRDLEGVLRRARESGVGNIITVGGGSGIESNYRAIEIARRFNSVFAAVGLHPENAEQFNKNAEEELLSLVKSERVVAIGETGFDLKYPVSIEKQKEAFLFQINLSKISHLPLIIHARDAFKETIDILRSGNGYPHSGVFHCYSGDREYARSILDLGFYISFTGVITFKNARGVVDVVRYLPIERMLLETDSPFLSPEPFRGRKNEPANLVYIAKKVAELKRLSVDDVIRITSANSCRLFGVGEPVKEGSIVYSIRESLYLNITNRCTNACVFCPKTRNSYNVKGYDLRLAAEPTIEEIILALKSPEAFSEVVFCGFGEPLLRLEVVKSLSRWLKQKGARVRVDTDGLANLVHGRNILPELSGVVDSISVSLNAPDAKTYARLCPSPYGETAFQAVLDFIREAKKYIPEVIASVVALPNLDIQACRALSESLGAKFRVREYNCLG